MQADNTFNISFTYQSTKMLAVVSRVCSGESILFKLQFGMIQYIFVETAGKWIVVSDFDPCKELKQKIISHLRKHLPVQNISNLTRLA